MALTIKYPITNTFLLFAQIPPFAVGMLTLNIINHSRGVFPTLIILLDIYIVIRKENIFNISSSANNKRHLLIRCLLLTKITLC